MRTGTSRHADRPSRHADRPSRHARRYAVAALVGFALVAAACGSDDNGETGETETTEVTTDTGATDTGATDTGATDTGATDTGATDTAPTDTGVAEQPVRGGTLRYGLEADVDGLNPTSSALSSPGLKMAGVVFDTLAAYDTEGNAVPYLAETIEPVDGDLSKWQVKLRDGITFHDDTPLNAAALQVNFERIKSDPLVGLAIRPYYPEQGAIEVIDDLTVQYNLLEPSAGFPGALTTQVGFIASPTWLDAAIADPTLNQAPVGTGPFVFDSRSPDSVTRFVRNDNWWNGDVFLDAVEFLPVPDPDTLLDLFTSGDLGGMQTSDPATVGELQDTDGVQNLIDETGEESFVMINSSVPPFDDIRARKALAFASPLENIRSLIGLGIARPADGIFTPESEYYNPDVVQEGDMPDEAIALVAEYCAEFATVENPVLGKPACTDGKINMEYQFPGPSVISTRTAEILDEGWSVAFNVTFDEVAQDDDIQQAALGRYNTVAWRQFGEVDPLGDKVYMMCRNIGGISLNWPKYCSENRDALINEAQALTDRDARVPLLQEISQDIHDAYTYIFSTHTIWDNALDESVQGACERTSPEGTLLQCTHRGRIWFPSVWIAE